MKSTNEMSVMNRVRDVILHKISDVLIYQAEEGIKFSPAPIISEPIFLVELMKEDAE